MKRNFHAGRQLNSGLSLNILTDDELQEIHYGTIEVLNETGVFVEDESALDLFEEGGADVDRDTKIVKIPPHVLEDAIRSAPSKVVLYGRDPKHDLVLDELSALTPLVILVEDEKTISKKHFLRNYKRHFEQRGFIQLAEINDLSDAGLGSSFVARVFKKLLA